MRSLLRPSCLVDSVIKGLAPFKHPQFVVSADLSVSERGSSRGLGKMLLSTLSHMRCVTQGIYLGLGGEAQSEAQGLSAPGFLTP